MNKTVNLQMIPVMVERLQIIMRNNPKRMFIHCVLDLKLLNHLSIYIFYIKKLPVCFVWKHWRVINCNYYFNDYHQRANCNNCIIFCQYCHFSFFYTVSEIMMLYSQISHSLYSHFSSRVFHKRVYQNPIDNKAYDL